DHTDKPHFHFWSRKMKIIVQENVIAKPIVLFIGKIPLAILPFGFFPTKSGRHSGLIIPRYGQSQLEGRFLRDFGYYWAISDYFDARATIDFYEFSGWFARGSFNYAKRYAFSGHVSGSVTRKNFTLLGSEERGWDIAFSHNQTFGTTASLRAAGAFASSNNYYSVLSGNRQEQLRRELRSQATFNKSLGSGRSSFSLNLSDVRDLETGSVEQLLPQFNLNVGQQQIFPGQEASKRKLASRGQIEDRSWYENFYFSFSSSARNRYFKTTADTSRLERQSSANHVLNLSYNSPKRFFGWLHWSQSLQFNEDWFDRATRYFLKPDSTIGSAEEKGFAARHVFSYNASMHTKLYGLFQPHLGLIKALRHVVTPSIGFSYRPDFSDPRWGYYQRLTLPDGTVISRDRFNGTTLSGKQASMTFSVANLFQIKTGPEDKPKKIDLFNLNFFTSHNFAAKEFRQGDLGANLFANPTRNISLNLTMSYSFYDYDRTTGQRINSLLYKKNGLFSGNYLRLTNLTAGASIRLQGKTAGGGSAAPPVTEAQKEVESWLPASPRDRFTTEQYFTDTSVPWQANFSLSFNYSRSNPLFPIKTAQLSLTNADIQLTKNWRLGVAGQFDLIEQKIVDQRYSIYRDLHCWEMQVFWTPSGIRRGFYFRLGIKAPLLHDIQIEQRGGRASVFGGSNFY
ncbi:MAG: putative LPS assembly protein LptD, partial [candidate division KSB1 bacterium]|nr:putative LPS assembly protein LptD [candidate division KSB1 bacterium]